MLQLSGLWGALVGVKGAVVRWAVQRFDWC
jgi:hypothetical protein